MEYRTNVLWHIVNRFTKSNIPFVIVFTKSALLVTVFTNLPGVCEGGVWWCVCGVEGGVLLGLMGV